MRINILVARNLLVTAPISTDISDNRQASVNRNNSLDEVCQSSANIVRVDSYDVVWRITGHVLDEDSLDVTPSTGITVENGTRAKKTAFLTSIPMKLKSVCGGKLCIGKHPESLQYSNRSRVVVISTRCPTRSRRTNAIKMSTDDHYNLSNQLLSILLSIKL